MPFASSPTSVIVIGGKISYYTSYATGTIYGEKVFGDQCNSVTIQNTSATDLVSFSFDGVTLHGELSGGESITVNVGNARSIFLKSASGTATVRVWGW
jgi:hypothetical protein